MCHIYACAKVALENCRRFDVGNPDWQGLAFALDPTSYGH